VLLSVVGCDAPVTLSSAAFLMETVRIVEEAAALQNAEASIGSDFDLTPVSGTDAASELLHMPPAQDVRR
jgi:hypothetical protein